MHDCGSVGPVVCDISCVDYVALLGQCVSFDGTPLIFFTADQHFYHGKIIGYVSRQVAGWGRLFENADEMNATIIERWNEKVRRDTDQVYVLGDFCLARGERALEVLRQLNGQIFIIPGGHDKRWLKDLRFNPERGDVGSIKLNDTDRVNVLPMLYHLRLPKNLGVPKVIVLCHYPFFTWEQSHYGSWHLHGHSHGGLGKNNRYQKLFKTAPTVLEDGNSIDVGVDAHDFYPISLDEIKSFLQ